MAASMMGLYLVGTTLLGMYAVTRSKDVQDFLVARRNLSASMVMALLFGEMISGAATVGKATEAFHAGFQLYGSTGNGFGVLVVCVIGRRQILPGFGVRRESCLFLKPTSFCLTGGHRWP